MIDRAMDFNFNPEKYMSYEKFVKVAIKDYRPINQFEGLKQLAATCYPCSDIKKTMVFKIDGADIHKNSKDLYILVSDYQLGKYGKTKTEFYDDWCSYHNEKKKTS